MNPQDADVQQAHIKQVPLGLSTYAQLSCISLSYMIFNSKGHKPTDF